MIVEVSAEALYCDCFDVARRGRYLRASSRTRARRMTNTSDLLNTRVVTRQRYSSIAHAEFMHVDAHLDLK
jgi:hypothetical protein